MKFGTKDSFLEDFYHFYTLQQSFIKKRLKKIQLTVPQARSLNYIFLHQGTIQKELASYLDKQNATVTNLLKSLEKNDYIIRKIPDDNERQKKLFLTEKGLHTVAEIQIIFIDLEEKIKQLISVQEKDSFAHILKKVTHNFLEK